MPLLCKECKEKKADTTVRGTCIGPSVLPPTQPVPDKHLPWTDSVNYSLCDACAELFKVCAWCWGPLEGHSGPTVPTDKVFCRQFGNNNGNHVEGMYVGEQILAQMALDLFGGTFWRIKKVSQGIVKSFERKVQIPGTRYAWQEMYFDLKTANSKAEIELEEVKGGYWSSGPTGNTWKITVEVKQQ